MSSIRVCTKNSEQVVREYADMLLHLAIAKTRNREYAQEVVQDTFLRLLEKTRDFNSDEHLKAWLIRVTINNCKKLWGTAWFQKTVALEPEMYGTTVMEEKSEVYYAMLELPEKYRVVLHLYYYEEMPIKEIAKVLDLNPATVETRVHRARGLLKKKLKGEYDYA